MSGDTSGTFVAVTRWSASNTWANGSISSQITGRVSRANISHYGNSGGENSSEDSKYTIDFAHTHSVTASGTVSVTTNPTFTGTSHDHTFTGTAVTSGAESQNHTHSVTASGSNSSEGGGQAHENMPPYIVKYCWERTA